MVILFAAMVAGGWYAHDKWDAKPHHAYRLLSDALDAADRTLTQRIDPARNHLRTAQRWLTQGALTGETIDAWSTFLLPQLHGTQGVRMFAIVTPEAVLWEACKADAGWVGFWREEGRIDGVRHVVRWDRAGMPIAGGALAYTHSLEPYEKATRSLQVEKNTGLERLYAGLWTPEDEPVSLVLAAPIGAELGQDAIVVVVLDKPNAEEISGSDFQEVTLALDPDGERLSQLEGSQTAALLTTRAIPLDANLALATLFPVQGTGKARQWCSARPFPIEDGLVWNTFAFLPDDAVPSPALPMGRYALAGVLTGLAGALVLALVMGRRISTPLALIAHRANSIHAIDEHYLPWPTSRFTEVNQLTSALEDLYESAVEHLDYHEAPLVVWAQPEALSGPDNAVDAQPLKRHINLRRGNDSPDTDTTEESGPVINVAGENAMPAVPAAQMQVLAGTRREVRRLQGQLAGACEELRTAGSHYHQSEERLKRQRKALRALDKQLQDSSAISLNCINVIADCLQAHAVSLWRTKHESGAQEFALRYSSNAQPRSTAMTAGLVLRALLKEELFVSARDIQADPRLSELKNHPNWKGERCGVLLAPLRFQGSVLGFLLAERREINSVWRADEESFLANCAMLCTMTLASKHQNGISRGRPQPASVNGPKNGSTPGNGTARNRPTPPELDEALHWETDLAGCIKSLEGNVKRIYGYPAAALVGQPVTFVSSREDGERDLLQLRRALSGAPCAGYECRHLTADGSPVVLEIHAEAIRDASGRIVGVRGTAVRATVSV